MNIGCAATPIESSGAERIRKLMTEVVSLSHSVRDDSVELCNYFRGSRPSNKDPNVAQRNPKCFYDDMEIRYEQLKSNLKEIRENLQGIRNG